MNFVNEKNQTTYLDVVSGGQALLGNTSKVIDTASQEVLEQTVRSASIARDEVLVS